MDIDPVQVGQWPVPNGHGHGVAVQGNIAYCTIGGDVVILDLGELSYPVLLGTHRDGTDPEAGQSPARFYRAVSSEPGFQPQ